MNIETAIISYWWLFSAHFIFDWGLQNRWMAENKSKYWEILFAHCMIYTGGITIVLQYIDSLALWNIIFLFITHFMTDLWSSRASKDKSLKTMRYILWCDHTIHFTCLCFVTINF